MLRKRAGRPRRQSKKDTSFTLLLPSNSEKKSVQFQLPPLFFKGPLTVTLLLTGLTGYGLIPAALLKSVACQKVVLEWEIAQLHAEQDKMRSENQNLRAYSAQRDKEMQDLQEMFAETKNNIENLQGRDNKIRGKPGLPAESSASGSGETAQAETQASKTSVGEVKTMEDLQPFMLGDAGESDIYDTIAGTSAENILQWESNIQLSVLMGARWRRNTIQLAAELEQSCVMLSEVSDSYDQYEGVIRLQEFQEEQRRERTTQRRQSIRVYAFPFPGGRYVWGGENPYSDVDCSGFMHYILSHAGGACINRTAAEQAQQGREVSIDETKSGDLIFYSNGSRVSHAAMYIGGGKVAYASNERNGIMASRWDYRTPVYIRNMVGE